MPSSLPDEEQLTAWQAMLGTHFRDSGLLRIALTHQSFLNEDPSSKVESNERLEFLGDGCLNYVVARHLFVRLPECPEGDLTARRAQAVRRETLASAARRARLGEMLVMGKGEEASGGSGRSSNLADCFEAIVGAVLVDRGVRAASAFVMRWLSPELKSIVRSDTPKDPKSRLQELLQSRGKPAPVYRLVDTTGPDNDLRFTIEVIVGGEALGAGTGRRKIDAERAAATEAADVLLSDGAE